MQAPFDTPHSPAPFGAWRVESQAAGNSQQDSAPPGRQIPRPLFAKLPEFLFRLQTLNEWQITKGLTPFRFARAAPPEHARVTLLGLKLGDEQRDEIALCGTVLFERMPNAVSDERRSRIGQISEHLLLDWFAPVSQAVPGPVIYGGRFTTHESS